LEVLSTTDVWGLACLRLNTEDLFRLEIEAGEGLDEYLFEADEFRTRETPPV